jgi:hypothetical protein
MTEEIEIRAGGIRIGFEPDCGYLTGLAVTDEGVTVAPLHVAPWAGEAMPDTAAPHQARLRGDYFCAPMGRGADGLHGLTANGRWQVMPTAPGTLRAVLQGAVQGATVVKEAQLQDGQPFLYQRHLFIGGSGALPMCSHAMVAVPNGAKLSFSRKRWFETPAVPVEPDPARGRSALAYPRRPRMPAEFPGADGGSVNLHRYPWGPAHEDFVSAIEEPASSLGWTAVVRPEEGDLFLSLKNPHALPMTMLWHSNGGRDYAPWNGRHRGCLGVEEGAALPNLGLSSREDPRSAGRRRPAGPGDAAARRHRRPAPYPWAIRWPSGQAVAGVMLEGDTLTVTGDWGAERRLPIRGAGSICPAPRPGRRRRRPDWDL